MLPLLTISDAKDVLTSLGLPLSPRQIRYLGIAPAHRGPGPNGGRLYDAADLALLAVYGELSKRFRRLGLPAWSARAAVRYREARLRSAMSGRRRSWLAIDPVRGTAELATTPPEGDAVDLRKIAGAIRRAVHVTRTSYPEIWDGAAYLDADELEEALA